MLRAHISLDVTDLDRSIDFYAALFDRSPSLRRDDYANWRLDEPGLHLSLVARPAGAPRPTPDAVTHYGIEHTDLGELDARAQRLKAAGLELRPEEKASCCYATAEKFWLEDPDGRSWELWVKTGEADHLHPASDDCCVPSSASSDEPAPATEAKTSSCCG